MVDEFQRYQKGLGQRSLRGMEWVVGIKTGGQDMCARVEFYNIENAKKVEDKNEQALRSGYGALIHVVYY